MKLFPLFIVIATLVFSSQKLRAQQGHCQQGQCTIKTAGRYLVELAGCNDYLDIYVLDDNNLPVKNKEITGTVEFYYLDETSLIAGFKQFFKTNSLRAHIPAKGFYNCQIKLRIGFDTLEVFFDNECNLKG